jgi:hypothetical protein
MKTALKLIAPLLIVACVIATFYYVPRCKPTDPGFAIGEVWKQYGC